MRMPPRGLIGLALILVAGCSSGGAAPTTSSSAATTSPIAASTTAQASQVALEASVLAPGVISSDEEEYRISFTPDGETAYFARGRAFFPQSREATIMESHLVDDEWSEPAVASFSGTYPDIDPWVSPDGASIYFSSIRPVEGQDRSDAEVWRVDRQDDGWSEPVHLPTIGSEGDELGASIGPDGVLWLASDRPGGAGGWDLYTAEPAGDGFAAPEPATDFNSAAWEFNPALSPDGETLVFTSINRPGGSGLGDLFLATRSGDGWSADEPAPINTPADEYHGSFSPDGRTVYFVRRAADGDLYEVELPRP